MGVLEVLGAIFSGGATGLVGVFLNTLGDYLQAKQEYAHEEAMAEIEMKHLKLEINRDVIISKQTANAKMEVAESQADQAAMEGSYESDQRRYLPTEAVSKSKLSTVLMTFVDFFRGIIRPVLTVFLTYYSISIYNTTSKLIEEYGTSMTAEQAFSLVNTCTIAVLYLTCTAVSWWFGSRAKYSKIANKLFKM